MQAFCRDRNSAGGIERRHDATSWTFKPIAVFHIILRKMLFLWLSLFLLYNTCQWSLANLYETALYQTGKSIKDRDREQKVGFQWCNTAITSACHNLQIYYSGTCQWMLKRIENMSKKEHGAARTETWVTFKKNKNLWLKSIRLAKRTKVSKTKTGKWHD